MSTKENLLHSTSHLIRSKGYHGTGINEILKKSEVPKGSLYHHFPGGKDEIIEKALEEAAADFSIAFKNAMKGQGSAINGLSAVIDVFIQDFESENMMLGCPLAAVSLDLTNENKELKTTCKRLFDFWISAVKSYLDYKGVAEADRKAESFLMRIEGALILSRVKASSTPFEIIKKELPQLIQG